jgi:hypothetical protein
LNPVRNHVEKIASILDISESYPDIIEL